MSEKPDPTKAPFGTIYSDTMAVAEFVDGSYEYPGSVQPFGNLSLSPASHALHYGSTIFEGLKAHRQPDGSVAIFRLEDHIARFQQSALHLRLPELSPEVVRRMIIDTVAANQDDTPAPPGSLYIRPTLIGTEPNIGAAAAPSAEALLYVITSPVGDYFAGGIRPLTLLVETETPRTTPQMGMVKSGANYVMALGPTLEAKAEHNVDQILFATDGDITETGAANFFMIDDERIITRNLDSSFLHGVTRSSVLAIAAEAGYQVEERAVRVDELAAWASKGEVFLSGTAAVMAPVGTLLLGGESIQVGDGQPGANTLAIRSKLTALQDGSGDDAYGWRTTV